MGPTTRWNAMGMCTTTLWVAIVVGGGAALWALITSALGLPHPEWARPLAYTALGWAWVALGLLVLIEWCTEPLVEDEAEEHPGWDM